MAKTHAALIPLLLATTSLFAAEQLDHAQSQAFRAWFTRIIAEQFRRGPTPRWTHRDCAGLVRFAAHEAFKQHDAAWLRANGLTNRFLPPEVELRTEQQTLVNNWRRLDGGSDAYVSALELIQENTRHISKDIHDARPGDLLFYDQGENQHLMIWTGRTVAYHTGSVTKQDNGLRHVQYQQLLQWKDTRWRPQYENPNFIGIFRFSFLPP